MKTLEEALELIDETVEYYSDDVPTKFIKALDCYTGLKEPFLYRKDGVNHKYVFEFFWRHRNKMLKEK